MPKLFTEDEAGKEQKERFESMLNRINDFLTIEQKERIPILMARNFSYEDSAKRALKEAVEMAQSALFKMILKGTASERGDCFDQLERVYNLAAGTNREKSRTAAA